MLDCREHLFLSVSSSVSDSGSSQGLSQPSTQTTQYLRADTPNNAASVTSKTCDEVNRCQEHHSCSCCTEGTCSLDDLSLIRERTLTN